MGDKGKFQVVEVACDQCLFSKNKIVSNRRKKELLDEIQAEQTYFVCHKTEDVCCRGFYDSPRAAYSQLIRIAERLGAVQLVSVDTIDKFTV